MDCPDAEALSAMAAGGLPADRRLAIANHAAECEDCHAVLDALLPSGADPIATTMVADRANAVTLPEPVEAPRQRTLSAGDKVDRYVIENVLGSGGMGVVYRARDPELDRPVAIKVLRRGMLGERLRREAQALAKLSHPNVVAVYDVGTHDDQPFIAMALVVGATLRVWLRAGHTRRAVLDVLLAAGRGIEAAHAAGLIHRDLKPDNIFVADNGQVLVGDFGLARGLDSAEREPPPPRVEHDRPSELTRTGMMLGTPAYMAPEQAAGDATVASDQFSFAVTAWEAFTKERPFGGATTGEILENIRIGMPAESDGERAMGSRIGAALRRALAADPTQRFASMTSFLRALEPPRRTRWIVAGGALAVAAVATTTIVLAQRPAPDPPPALPALVCDDEAGLLAGDWNPVHRETIARALAKQSSSAMTARTLARLDRFAASWITGRRAACETARTASDRRLYGEQVECFERARRELRFVAEVLRTNSTLASADASELVETMPPVERCSNPASLVHVAPVEPSKQAAVDRVSAALVRNRVARQVAELRDLRPEVEAIGYLPLLGELARAEAIRAYDRSDHASAEAAARKALAIADQLRDDLSRAAMAALVGLILARQGKFEGAAEQIGAAEAAWVRAGKDPQIEVEILVARADLSRIQDLPDRVATTERMVDRVRAVYGPHSIRLAKALMTLVVMYDAGQRDRAQRAAREASQIWSLQSGSLEQSIMTATAKVDAAKQAGDLRSFIAHTHELVAVVASGAPGSPDEAFALFELGVVYELAAQWDDAAQAYQLALAIFERDPAIDRQLVFDSLISLGRVLVESGRSAPAIVLLERARGMVTRTLPANRDDTSILDVALGRAYAAAGRNREAVAILDPMVEQLRDVRPPRHMRFGLVCSTLALAAWATGGTRDRDRARALAHDAQTAWNAAIAELRPSPLRSAQVQLLERRQAVLADWIAKHP